MTKEKVIRNFGRKNVIFFLKRSLRSFYLRNLSPPPPPIRRQVSAYAHPPPRPLSIFLLPSILVFLFFTLSFLQPSILFYLIYSFSSFIPPCIIFFLAFLFIRLFPSSRLFPTSPHRAYSSVTSVPSFFVFREAQNAHLFPLFLFTLLHCLIVLFLFVFLPLFLHLPSIFLPRSSLVFLIFPCSYIFILFFLLLQSSSSSPLFLVPSALLLFFRLSLLISLPTPQLPFLYPLLNNVTSPSFSPSPSSSLSYSFSVLHFSTFSHLPLPRSLLHIAWNYDSFFSPYGLHESTTEKQFLVIALVAKWVAKPLEDGAKDAEGMQQQQPQHLIIIAVFSSCSSFHLILLLFLLCH